jgi:hypothetical protein
MSNQLALAKHDPAMALMPIVRPVRRGYGPVRGMDVSQRFGAATIRVLGPYYLTREDQTLLLTILALAGVSREILEADDDGQQVREALACDGDAKERDTIWIDTSLNELSRAIYGRIRQERMGDLDESLARLSAVSVRIAENDTWGQSHLIGTARSGDKYRIAVNWRLAVAVAGYGSHFTAISLSERRMLKGDIAQIAHGWLSAWLRPGRIGRISLDQLTEKVWGERPDNNATMRTRRKRLRDALAEIEAIPNWELELEGYIVSIRRNAPTETFSAPTETLFALTETHEFEEMA